MKHILRAVGLHADVCCRVWRFFQRSDGMSDSTITNIVLNSVRDDLCIICVPSICKLLGSDVNSCFTNFSSIDPVEKQVFL